jgi:hypothetical protein
MKFLKNLAKYFLLAVILINFNLAMVQAQATTSTSTSGGGNTGLGLIKNKAGLNAQTAALEGAANLETMNGSRTGITTVIATIIEVALGLLGIIFLVLMVMSGYQWMMAGGNEEEVTKAQSRMKNAIIGLVIVLAAYAITAFVFSNLPFGATISGGNM